MANRNFPAARVFGMHLMPVHLDASISIGASGAPTLVNALGVNSIVRKAAGIYQVQLQDNYASLLVLDGNMQSPQDSPAVAAGSFVVGVPYAIASVGSTVWSAIGLPAGVVPIVGSVFVATGVGAGSGTAKSVSNSGISCIEQIGSLQQNQPYNFPSGGYFMFQTLETVLASPPVSPDAPDMGSARDFAVLGGSAVTNTGSSVVTGDLGSSPTGTITGFPPGVVIGTIHSADAAAAAAQVALTAAYVDLASRPPGPILGALGGLTLTPGTYTSASSMSLTGVLTLDAEGDPDAVWIFQMGSTLTTASASSVVLINGGRADNVFWQVGSSATIGTTSSMKGNILALTSITFTTGASIEGRALARNGATTLDSNIMSMPDESVPASSPADPAEGSILHLSMLLNNSAVQ